MDDYEEQPALRCPALHSARVVTALTLAACMLVANPAAAEEECSHQATVIPEPASYDPPVVFNKRTGSVISPNFFNGGAIADQRGKRASICVTSPNNAGKRRVIIQMDVGMDNNFQIKAYPEIIVGSKFGNHWETSHRYYDNDPLSDEHKWYVISDNNINFANLEYLTSIRKLGLPAYTSDLPRIDISLDMDETNVVGAERDVMLESWFYDVSKNADVVGSHIANTLNNIVGSGHPGFPALNTTLLEMMVHVGALSPNDVSRANNDPGEDRLTVALSGNDLDSDGIDDALDIDFSPSSVDLNLDGIADDKFPDITIGDFRYSIWYGTTHVAPLILFSRETTASGSPEMNLSSEGVVHLDWNAFLDFALFQVEPMLQANSVDWAIGDSNPFPAMRSASGAISAVEFGVELQTNAAADLPYIATINQYDVTIDGIEHGIGILDPDQDTDNDGYDNLTEFHTNTHPLIASDRPAPVELPSDRWQLLSLPLNGPSAGASVAELFADDITGTYGIDWIIFLFDSTTNRYIDPGSDGVLEPGAGFWIIQSTDQTAWLDMPAGSTSVETVQSPACGAFSGCYEIDLPLSADGTPWNLIGNPYHAPAPAGSIRLRSATGHCSGPTGCSIVEQADDSGANLLNSVFFGFNGNRYDAIDETGSLLPWRGYWALVTTTDSQMSPTMLLRRN